MTPYLFSRATLRHDVPAAALWQELAPHDTNRRMVTGHRLLWTLFADSRDRKRDFLWRESEPGTFYILSARPPHDHHQFFSLEPAKPFAPLLNAGDVLRFSLRANATISIRPNSGERARGKPSDVVMHALHSVPGSERAAARTQAIRDAGLKWLRERGARCGFNVIAGSSGEDTCVTGYQVMRLEGSRSAARLGVLDYEGMLQVEDPSRFVESLTHGFGRAKAFGCGLMLIRRAT